MNEIFNSNPFIHSLDKRLNYINEQETKRINLYGIKYIEYIEGLYYDNIFLEKRLTKNEELYKETGDINEINNDISMDELINITLKMDMNITNENIKYIEGLIYDLDLVEYWNDIDIINKIKMYQLLSTIKNTFSISELNQIQNIPISIGQSLFTRKYNISCYVNYNKEVNKLTEIGLIYKDEIEFLGMMKNDLGLNIDNVMYIQQLILIDRDNKIKKKIIENNDYLVIGIYRCELTNRNENYWRWYNYEIFNEYFLGRIYDMNMINIEYKNLCNNEDYENKIDNRIIIRNKKRDMIRKRLSNKRKRQI